MPPSLSGPAAPPLSGKPARHMVILLHGLGVDGNDLFGLVPSLAPHVPDAAFAAPHAPFPCDMAPYGRQWFSLQDLSPDLLLAQLNAIAPLVDAFIDEHLAAHGLSDADLALVGFSQGTMTALHVGLRRPRPCAGLIGFSGALIDDDHLAAEIRCRPRTLLIHGEDDTVVNPSRLVRAEAVLTALGVPVQAHLRPGLEHAIDEEGLKLAADFLRQAFYTTESAG